MITTIVFDIGGVFFHQPDELLNTIWQKYGSKKGRTNTEIMYGDVWELYKRGSINEEEYWQRISRTIYQSTASWSALRDDFENAVVLDQELVAIVKDLKKHYRVHALSNAGAELERRLDQFHIIDLFDVIVNSHYAKLAKPDEEIYRLTCERVQAKPEQILFVDDKVRNTSIAEKMGFNVHVYTTAQNFFREWKEMNEVIKH